MSDTKPALTADQWTEMAAPEMGEDTRDGDTLFAYVLYEKSEFIRGQVGDLMVAWNGDRSLPVHDGTRHALAALCLHEQPFGFTREDVELLRAMAHIIGRGTLDHLPAYAERDGLRSIADRIMAMMPPETS